MGVGMPAHLKLELFASVLQDVFGEMPYLVGSARNAKQGWRDVDIRLILSDEDYASWFGDVALEGHNRKWAAMCMAFASLGREMTGLPIDFQIQQQTKANRQHDGQRDCLGMRYRRSKLQGWDEIKSIACPDSNEVNE